MGYGRLFPIIWRCFVSFPRQDRSHVCITSRALQKVHNIKLRTKQRLLDHIVAVIQIYSTFFDFLPSIFSSEQIYYTLCNIFSQSKSAI
jgi:hypothetical protein